LSLIAFEKQTFGSMLRCNIAADRSA